MRAHLTWIPATFLLWQRVIGAEECQGDINVGVYYYPWHTNDFHRDGYVREFLQPKQLPTLGEYDDRNSSVISQHLKWSRDANVNLWVASWWGEGSDEDVTLLKHILPHQDFDNMQIAIHYETNGRTNDFTDFSNIAKDVQYLVDHYFDHPNYLHIDNRPVVFLYDVGNAFIKGKLDDVLVPIRSAQENLGVDIYLVADAAYFTPLKLLSYIYKPAIEKVDALTNYGVYGSMQSLGVNLFAGQIGVNRYYDSQASWKDLVNSVGRGFIPTVTPGYNDRGVREGNAPLSRKLLPSADHGTFFRASLKRATQLVDENAGKLLMVVSFNEWHEDTQIEPIDPKAGITKKDVTEGFLFGLGDGFDYTWSLPYESYGTKYIDMLSEETCNV